MREKESQKCETLVVVNSGKSMTSDSQGIMAKGRGNMEDNIEVMAEEKKWQKNIGLAQATSHIMWPLKI